MKKIESIKFTLKKTNVQFLILFLILTVFILIEEFIYEHHFTMILGYGDDFGITAILLIILIQSWIFIKAVNRIFVIIIVILFNFIIFMIEESYRDENSLSIFEDNILLEYTILFGIILFIVYYFKNQIQEKNVFLKSFYKDKNPSDFYISFTFAKQDSGFFQIDKIAALLKEKALYTEVFFWKKFYIDEIYEYMNESIQKSDILVVFCSKNSIESESVKLEWMNSLKLNKPIITVFVDPIYIPALLTTKFGVIFYPKMFDQFINELYQLIEKTVKKNKQR